MALPFVQALHHGIHRIDTGFHRDDFDAAYLIIDQGRAAFVDTGTNFSVPRLLAALDDLGLPREAVDFVIPTPLYQGALAVYGQAEMDRAYGQLQPVAAERVRSPADGETVLLADRPLLFTDTPGHARHHHCIWDARSQGWFTGDTFGLGYPEFHTAAGDWVMPTSTPVQFEPEALHTSIDTLLARQPRCMYLTHYGQVDDVPRLAGLLHRQIDAMVALALRLHDDPRRHEALVAGLQALYGDALRAHGVADVPAVLAGLDLDIGLNAQGLAIWLDRPAR
ncbi:MAG: MBL fold metallo-hydrolase [Burkholderiales bacterium PBB5]|nr:MAG: MBL fold metallo-hydrolase [Burkholderiales bacterium PBB5]